MKTNGMKMIAAVALAACFVAPAAIGAREAQAAISPAVSVALNQWTVELQHTPLLENGAVYMPLRETGTLLNSRTTWIAEGKRILVNRPGVRIEMTLGSKQATVNGEPYTLTAMPKNVNGVVFVPVRFVSEALGAEVQWVDADWRVELTFDQQYLFAERGAKGYWVHKESGELFVSENGNAAERIADTNIKIYEYGGLQIETLSDGVELLRISDNYGEPHLNDVIYGIVLTKDEVALETKVHYYGFHPIRNVTEANGNPLLIDGATLYEVDAAGKTVATHDLAALTGYEDAAFQVEWYDSDYMIVRPHATGWLTLIDRKTNAATRLADELLDEEQLETYRTLPKNEFEFRNWDGLRTVGLEANVLKLKYQWFLDGNQEVDLTYTIPQSQ